MPAQDGRQAAELAALGREVGRLQHRLDQHEREHERAERVREDTARDRERSRRATRRYWVTTMATVITSNVATVLIIEAAHHV